MHGVTNLGVEVGVSTRGFAVDGFLEVCWAGGVVFNFQSLRVPPFSDANDN